MKSPQPATTITLHFRPKVMHPVLWRTRGNVLAVAGLKDKRPKRETSESLLLHKDWSELRWERQRERDPKPREIFALLCFFPWWVGPTSKHSGQFRFFLTLTPLLYLYVCTANFSSLFSPTAKSINFSS